MRWSSVGYEACRLIPKMVILAGSVKVECMRDSKGMHVSAREVGRSKQLGAELQTILVLDLAGFSVQINHLAHHNICQGSDYFRLI